MLQKPLSSLSTYSEPLQVPKHQIFKYKMIETDSSILLTIFPDDGICIRYDRPSMVMLDESKWSIVSIFKKISVDPKRYNVI